MKEYIERDFALYVVKYFGGMLTWDKEETIAEIVRILNKIPASDVADRVRGVWLDRRKEDCYADEEPYVVKIENGCPEMGCYCSICGDWLTASDEYSVRGNFCPNCGADMRGEKHG